MHAVAASRQLRRAPPATGAAPWSGGPVLVLVVVLLLCLQVAPLVAEFRPLRTHFRVAAFLCGAAPLLLVRSRARSHPAAGPALCVVAVVLLSAMHPWVNSPLAALAQACLYIAVLAPLFWVPWLDISSTDLRRAARVLWGFHLAAAALGIAQATIPGLPTFEISPVVAEQGADYVRSLHITLADGRRVLRPSGLSDSPGGAGLSGLLCALLGIAFILTDRQPVLRVVAGAGVAVGLAAIYFSQVRSTLIVFGVSVLVVCAVLALRGRYGATLGILGVIAVAAVGSFLWSAQIGGDAITERFSTLIADDPLAVYQANRGTAVYDSISVWLAEYPLGAGPGRWGMMSSQFGDSWNRVHPPTFTEVQFGSWALDGGIPLTLAYVTAVGVALFTTLRCALSRAPGEAWIWSTVILGYGIGVAALTASFTPFTATEGQLFWLLVAAVFTASLSDRRAARSRPAGLTGAAR